MIAAGLAHMRDMGDTAYADQFKGYDWATERGRWRARHLRAAALDLRHSANRQSGTARDDVGAGFAGPRIATDVLVAFGTQDEPELGLNIVTPRQFRELSPDHVGFVTAGRIKIW